MAGEILLTVQGILDEWSQFIRIQRKPGEKPLYSIYHKSFNNFFYRQNIVEEVESLVAPIQEQIADQSWKMLYGQD
ncbi:hypothetical protein [Geitlerinema sp. P-1104]|uniref:hypothetical protein n=1 Tax=Geitlerinema sp. P-1104 TaxID=2546230 RepID=UPI001981C90D|nr:hypothetical protein [Geitlerinema sp. P-1104]